MDSSLILSTTGGTKIPGNGPGGAILTHSFSVGPLVGGAPGQGQRVEIESFAVVLKIGNWLLPLEDAVVSGMHFNGFLEAHSDSQKIYVCL